MTSIQIKLLVSFILAFSLVSQQVAGQEPVLEGPNIVHFLAPTNFIEKIRFIRQGKLTPSGMCEFVTSLHAELEETVVEHELAYDPDTCRSLIVQGAPVGPRTERPEGWIIDQRPAIETQGGVKSNAATPSSGPSVSASMRTWYEDPIGIDINEVKSNIWWDPTPSCAFGTVAITQGEFSWLTPSGWIRESWSDNDAVLGCPYVSLKATAHYSNSLFPTCLPRVDIFYDENTVFGYANKTATGTSVTRKLGPSQFCTEWQSEHKELTVSNL